jgi:hypothetical protein
MPAKIIQIAATHGKPETADPRIQSFINPIPILYALADDGRIFGRLGSDEWFEV